MTKRLRPYTILSVLFALCTLLTLNVHAQNDALPVTRTAEYDIGVNCPVSVTLDPTKTVIWVLMDDCFTRNFGLHGFNTVDGSPVTVDPENFKNVLAPLDDQVVYAPNSPLAFAPDGTVDVIYYDLNSYDALNVRLSLTSDAPTDRNLTLLTLEIVKGLIPAYAGYLESTVYNTDHTVAIVADTVTFHIIDLQTGAELFRLEGKPETYGSFPSFSADGKSLYITTLKNREDVKDYSAVLNIYSLPDGALKATYNVPSFILWVSPDGRYAAAQSSDTGLVVIELATGSISPVQPINEKPHLVTKCLNNGHSVTDLNYMTQGNLFLMDLTWLPDSSGFLTVNSYLGDGAEGSGSVCIFDYSRLRHYMVGAGG